MGGHVVQERFTTLPFTHDSETWVIDPSVLILSNTGNGVFSDQNLSVLVNNGNIYSEAASGVLFDLGSTNGVIVNSAGSTIKGVANGIGAASSGLRIDNHGAVFGTGAFGNGVAFGPQASGGVLNNDGTIYGSESGVFVNAQIGGDTINNSGAVKSAVVGLYIDTIAGLTSINNNAGGTITGTADAILAVTGQVSLVNHGTIVGSVRFSNDSANDKIVNTGTISGDVRLFSGDDRFDGRSGGAAKVYGDPGNDALIGSNHNDTFDGGFGNDRLTGGRGKDVLTGGPDADTFLFRLATDSVVGAKRDQILDFGHTEGDRIDLSQIDADAIHLGNQTFVFIGGDTFAHYHSLHPSAFGMVRYAGGIVQGNVNANLAADFEIKAAGAAHTADFVL